MVGVRERGVREAWLAWKWLLQAGVARYCMGGKKKAIRVGGRDVGSFDTSLYSWCLSDTVVYSLFLYVRCQTTLIEWSFGKGALR